MIIAYQLQYVNAAANNTCKCCKQFNKAQRGEQRVRNYPKLRSIMSQI